MAGEMEVDADSPTGPSCPICFQSFKLPVKAECGHPFCKACAFEWLRRSASCPICRSPISARSLQPALEIKTAPARCEHCASEALFDAAGLDAHLEQCPEAPVPGCSNVACRGAIPRRRLAEHGATCLYTTNACPTCGGMHPAANCPRTLPPAVLQRAADCFPPLAPGDACLAAVDGPAPGGGRLWLRGRVLFAHGDTCTAILSDRSHRVLARREMIPDRPPTPAPPPGADPVVRGARVLVPVGSIPRAIAAADDEDRAWSRRYRTATVLQAPETGLEEPVAGEGAPEPARPLGPPREGYVRVALDAPQRLSAEALAAEGGSGSPGDPRGDERWAADGLRRRASYPRSELRCLAPEGSPELEPGTAVRAALDPGKEKDELEEGLVVRVPLPGHYAVQAVTGRLGVCTLRELVLDCPPSEPLRRGQRVVASPWASDVKYCASYYRARVADAAPAWAPDAHRQLLVRASDCNRMPPGADDGAPLLPVGASVLADWGGTFFRARVVEHVVPPGARAPSPADPAPGEGPEAGPAAPAGAGGPEAGSGGGAGAGDSLAALMDRLSPAGPEAASAGGGPAAAPSAVPERRRRRTWYRVRFEDGGASLLPPELVAPVPEPAEAGAPPALAFSVGDDVLARTATDVQYSNFFCKGTVVEEAAGGEGGPAGVAVARVAFDALPDMPDGRVAPRHVRLL
eukprot:tig00020610_g12030.t1